MARSLAQVESCPPSPQRYPRCLVRATWRRGRRCGDKLGERDVEATTTKKAENEAANVVVGVTEIVAEFVGDEDQLWREGLEFGPRNVHDDGLQVEKEKLLESVVLGGEDVAYDGDQEMIRNNIKGLAATIEEKHHCLLHSLNLRLHVASFQGLFDLVHRWCMASPLSYESRAGEKEKKKKN